MASPTTNLLTLLRPRGATEQIDVLLETAGVRLERIVSMAHATPAGEWYDQDADEWVALLSGSAALRFEDEATPRELRRGDCLLIAAHRRHRVEWTDAREPTIWLALHLRSA